MEPICFIKISEDAIIPERKTKGSVGYDLHSNYTVTISAHGRALVATDIAVKLPTGTYGRVAARSGLANQHGIIIGGGVIDQDYRGNIGVIMFNNSDQEFLVNKHDRIAQLICEVCITPDVYELKAFPKETSDNERGQHGFGSTGRN